MTYRPSRDGVFAVLQALHDTNGGSSFQGDSVMPVRKFTQRGFDDWCNHISNLQLARDKLLMQDRELREHYIDGLSSSEVASIIRQRDAWEPPDEADEREQEKARG